MASNAARKQSLPNSAPAAAAVASPAAGKRANDARAFPIKPAHPDLRLPHLHTILQDDAGAKVKNPAEGALCSPIPIRASGSRRRAGRVACAP
jgi:hypothetical protein